VWKNVCRSDFWIQIELYFGLRQTMLLHNDVLLEITYGFTTISDCMIIYLFMKTYFVMYGIPYSRRRRARDVRRAAEHAAQEAAAQTN
jgi:hypothetical protein